MTHSRWAAYGSALSLLCSAGVAAAPDLTCARGLKPADIEGIVSRFEASAGAFQDQFDILTVPHGPGRDSEVAAALVGAAMANEMAGTLVTVGPMLSLRDDFYAGAEREHVTIRVAEIMSVVVARAERVEAAYRRIETRTTQSGIRREAFEARRLLADVRASFCMP